MRGRELKARHWAAAGGSQLSDEGGKEGGGGREGILNRCYLCSPVPAGFVSVKVGVEQRILPMSRLLIFFAPRIF